MLEISYHNVTNGFNKKIPMCLVSPDMQYSYTLFRNSCKLWGNSPLTKINNKDWRIEHNKVLLVFKSIENLTKGNWAGFRGLFLIHPELVNKSLFLNNNQNITLSNMKLQNERYMKSWHH